MRRKFSSKKTSPKACGLKKSLLLLHPLRETHNEFWKARKQRRHVPRHIELTAVFKRDFKNNIKRVRESRDLKNH